MAKCTECGRSAGFGMSVCTDCIVAANERTAREVAAERDRAIEQQRRTQDRVSGVLLATTQHMAGFEIDRTIEVVTAECAIGLNALKDIMIGARDLFGGRSETLQIAMREAHDVLLDELRAQAVAHSANGVVAIHIAFTLGGSGASTLLLAAAHGTAVILKPIRRMTSPPSELSAVHD